MRKLRTWRQLREALPKKGVAMTSEELLARYRVTTADEILIVLDGNIVWTPFREPEELAKAVDGLLANRCRSRSKT